ncbi:hypothetical protein HanXRQr2_Chr10g0453421 [Helianthus annuus]|uniref:Uncharacterized protein n=1 Tax=Helianthus annuus TaxID=4232 RepID=A0A251TM50_HELAN|nr:hypothetical protein HanXRQr2_Chr10g0453421 [Helianthus annuus]KAJ0884751.1 hypothetical protein HanPSC8_Chr10g0437531 [Helianthus annuus]
MSHNSKYKLAIGRTSHSHNSKYEGCIGYPKGVSVLLLPLKAWVAASRTKMKSAATTFSNETKQNPCHVATGETEQNPYKKLNLSTRVGEPQFFFPNGCLHNLQTRFLQAGEEAVCLVPLAMADGGVLI